jgi:hypothetical protein
LIHDLKAQSSLRRQDNRQQLKIASRGPRSNSEPHLRTAAPPGEDLSAFEVKKRRPGRARSTRTGTVDMAIKQTIKKGIYK